ncbi:hypothetical protein GCM10008967_36920 [Bacillus carboniphilus]|uniref:N-acetyltransferase domain-containing protein n=1 Tax=Bacillus carboniphilus TaxID=86663 RepID=A0ABN0WPI5_9BACI
MNTILNTKYFIRNYQEQDAEQIAKMDFVNMLAYKYNGDYVAENIYCVVDSDETVYGAGHLEPDQTWFLIEKEGQPSNFVYKLNLQLYFNEDHEIPIDVQNALYETLLNRATEIKSQYPDKKVRLSHTIHYEDLEEMDYFLSKGFVVERNHMIMKRDLTEDIPEVTIPDSIKIVNWKMETEAEEEKYLLAAAEGDDEGVTWSLNRLRWTKAGGEWDTFTAFAGDQVVGSVMTWGLGAERSATESIFVLPEWRRQGIAKAVITESLKFLKSKGKKEATLGVFGENEKAIPLYLSLGYKMFFIIIEFGRDI